MNTKQRIIKEALVLFSQHGYDAVSVAQIGEAVGIKAPSLYKHYKSKQEIFQAIVVEMSQRYNEQMRIMMLNGVDPNADIKTYIGADVEQLLVMGKALFHFYLHDEVLSQFRKMLSMERFHNTELAALFHKHYFEDPIAYQSQIFAYFIQNGTMKNENPEIIALHFYTPLFTLLMFCDTDMSKEEKIIAMLEEHVRQFHRLYVL